MILTTGTTNIVVGSVNGDTNQTLGTAGTPFFTNTFNILPSPASIHTAYADWTNYYFGVITNAIPTNAIGQPIGIDIWQSTTQYNSGADATKSWLQFDAVVVVPTNGIPPIAAPVTISPTNSVYGGETLTLGENAFGSLPITYQWQTDGGGGGTLTNINLGFSTNILTVVTPTK